MTKLISGTEIQYDALPVGGVAVHAKVIDDLCLRSENIDASGYFHHLLSEGEHALLSFINELSYTGFGANETTDHIAYHFEDTTAKRIFDVVNEDNGFSCTVDQLSLTKWVARNAPHLLVEGIYTGSQVIESSMKLVKQKDVIDFDASSYFFDMLSRGRLEEVLIMINSVGYENTIYGMHIAILIPGISELAGMKEDLKMNDISAVTISKGDVYRWVEEFSPDYLGML